MKGAAANEQQTDAEKGTKTGAPPAELPRGARPKTYKQYSSWQSKGSFSTWRLSSHTASVQPNER